VFTLDKVLGALIKQVQTLLADVPLTMKLLELLKVERASPTPYSREERARYLWDTRATLPDENVFRIDWDSTSGAMGMQLLGKDEDEGVDEEVLFERWQTYVDAFVSVKSIFVSSPTSALTALAQTDAQTPTTIRARPPFLHRSLKGADRASADVLARGGLGIKVCVRTYRLFFVPGSEDVLVREPELEEVKATEAVVQRATQKRRGWIEDLDRGVMNGIGAIEIL
jgi:paired amphipathic helix protein Sin3a